MLLQVVKRVALNPRSGPPANASIKTNCREDGTPCAPTPGEVAETRCQMSVNLMPHSARGGAKAGFRGCAYEEARGARLNRNSCLWSRVQGNGRHGKKLLPGEGPRNSFAEGTKRC